MEEDPGCSRHRLQVGGERALDGESPGRCGRCDTRLPPAIPDRSLCAVCRRGGGLPRIRSVFDYHTDTLAREWILALKHRPRPDLALHLGALLAARLLQVEAQLEKKEVPEIPLSNVPAHPLRRFERGSDQAKLLALGLLKALEKNPRSDVPRLSVRYVPLLRRVRWTAPQGSPGARTRAANVSGAFRARRRKAREVAGKRLWLIDDVVVSGASVRACQRALSGFGLGSFQVLALARAEVGRRDSGPW